jgi:hypothetical protein
LHSTEQAKSVIDNLPEESTMDDVIHALYLLARFTHGEEEIRQGKGVAHEDAKERLGKWLR